MNDREVTKRCQTMAAEFVKGDGTVRTMEQITAGVARILEHMFDEGRLAGAVAARENVLREALAIATGDVQAATARMGAVGKELAELEAARAKRTK